MTACGPWARSQSTSDRSCGVSSLGTTLTAYGPANQSSKCHSQLTHGREKRIFFRMAAFYYSVSKIRQSRLHAALNAKAPPVSPTRRRFCVAVAAKHTR